MSEKPKHTYKKSCGCEVVEPDEYVDARDADAMEQFGISYCSLHKTAPDMLAALKATARALGDYTSGRCNHPTTVPEVEEMARAAIAEASE